MSRRLVLPAATKDNEANAALQYLADNAATRLLDEQTGKPRASEGDRGGMQLRVVDGEHRLYLKTRAGWKYAVLIGDT